MRLVSRPLVDGQPAGVSVTFSITPVTNPEGLKLAYESETSGAWRVARVRCLDSALTVTEEEQGCLYVPERLGIELPAATGLPGSQQWVTYDGLSTAMCGAVKDGSALMYEDAPSWGQTWLNKDARGVAKQGIALRIRPPSPC